MAIKKQELPSNEELYPRHTVIQFLIFRDKERVGRKDCPSLRQSLKVCRANITVLYLLTSRTTHGEVFLLNLQAEVSPTKKVCSYASGATAAERVENPRSLPCACLNKSCQYRQRFLSGMLSARLLPDAYCWQSPDIRHLLIAIEFLHQLIVKEMRHFLLLPRPDYELCGVGEISARDIWRRVCLRPCHHVQNLKAQFQKLLLHAEDIMMSTRNPYCSILFHMVADSRQPSVVEGIHILCSRRLIPLALINTHHLPTLVANATAREEVRRVGKHHVKTKPKLRQGLHTVALDYGEVVGRGFIVRSSLISRNSRCNVIITNNRKGFCGEERKCDLCTQKKALWNGQRQRRLLRR